MSIINEDRFVYKINCWYLVFKCESKLFEVSFVLSDILTENLIQMYWEYKCINVLTTQLNSFGVYLILIS